MVDFREFFNPGQNLGRESPQLHRLCGQLRQHDPGGAGAGYRHGLLAHGSQDFGRRRLVSSLSELAQQRGSRPEQTVATEKSAR